MEGGNLHEVKEFNILFDQRDGKSCCLADVIKRHAFVSAHLDSSTGLGVMLDSLRTVEGFESDLTGGLFLDEAFVTDDGLMSECHS